MRSLGWVLIQYDPISKQKTGLRQKQREDLKNRQKMASYKPGESLEPHHLQKEPGMPTP
jgi:hypothetical protein